MTKIVQNNIEQFKSMIRDSVEKTVKCIAETSANIYIEKLNEKRNANSPNGPFLPPYSSPGDYPSTQTGQGSENVAFEHLGEVDGEFVSGFGVKGEGGTTRSVSASGTSPSPGNSAREPGGMHLIELTKRGWKGPADILKEHLSDIIAACARGQ